MNSRGFEKLGAYVSQVMTDAANQIMQGEISIAPYKDANHTGCDYCPYMGICRFDPRVPGNGYREQEKLSNDDVFIKIEEKLKEDTDGR